MTSSYPRRETTVNSVIREARICTELPSFPLPESLVLPSLPSPVRSEEFFPGYTVTTHLVPAAYPRYSYQEPRRYAATSRDISNDAPLDSAPKDIRHNWAKETASKLLKKRQDLLNARVEHLPQDGPGLDPGSVLWNAVNRYARTEPPKDIREFGLTVIICHENGLHKEVITVCSILYSLSDKTTELH